MKKIMLFLFMASCLFAIKTQSQTALDSGLVAYYPFTGNAGDSSIYGNDPTFNNATLTTDRFGNANSAYRFNGTNSYMQIPHNAAYNINNTISLCVWVKVSGFYYGTCHSNLIMQKGNYNSNTAAFALQYSDMVNNCSNPTPDTLNEVFYGLNAGDTATKIKKEKWYFLVFTYENDLGKFYVDGQLKETRYSPGQTFANSFDLMLGKLGNPQYPYWLNGSLDDIRIYNRAINSSEVNTLFGGYTVIVPPPIQTGDSSLVAYYPFNGNAGDSSVYGNHPAFNNATLTTDRFGNPNSAYKFDGTNSYMIIPNAPSLNCGQKITLCAWVKVKGFYKGTCHGNYIMSKFEPGGTGYQGYLLAFDDAPYYNYNQCPNPVDTIHQNFYGAVGSYASQPYVQKERWEYVVYTCDGINVKLYVDSRLCSQKAFDPLYSFTNTGDLRFGKTYNPSYPNSFNGILDDVRIYNRALSDSEVTFLHTDAPPYPIIRGNVFIDVNSNGVMDGVDYPKANVRIDLSNGAYTFTDNNGNYELFADGIGAYTVTAQAPPFYTAAPTTTNYFFNTYTAQVVNNIALQPSVAKDSLSINVIPLVMTATPGGAYPYWINYQNNGTTVLSPTVSVSYNNYMLTYDSCTDINATPTANGLVTGQANMAPGTQNNLIGYFTIKPSNNVGDTLQTTYNISGGGAVSGDGFYTILEGATVSDGQRATPSLTAAQVAAGKEIVYTIGFRNTTTSNILDVVIEDSLSSFLQANTLQIISSSHKCKTTVKGNRVLFELMDIKIPTATSNALKSYGFVSFKIKPKTTLVAGNTIISKAYTSYNNLAPIITTATTLVKPVVTPVQIKSYELKLMTEKQVTNYWTTSTEINTSYFNIQRSVDGRNFTTLGKVNAGKNSYSFVDSKLPTTNEKLTLYYRLEVIDKDGSKAYSEVKQITINDKKQTINVYPNPATNEINISRNISSNIAERLTITDVAGKIIKIIQLKSVVQIVNISDFEKGIYLLHFENGEIIKIIKQ